MHLPEYLKPYKRWLLWCFGISLAIHCLGAWFSLGFYHYDEHFQILEFANARAGYSHLEDLPWEYGARLRPTLQPWIAIVVIKIFHAIGNPDPYDIATALRFISAILGWFVSIVFCIGCFRWVKSETGRKALILLSAGLWLPVFLHIRFSSESWAADLFFLALGLLFIKLRDVQKEGRVSSFLRSRHLILVGLLFGFSVVFRYQNVLLLPGIFLWLWVVARLPFKRVFVMGLIALVPLVIGVVLDRLFYGEWAISFWNYYDANINQGVAAKFGVSPWWWYFPQMVVYGKVAGALFWIGLLYLLFRRPKDAVLWALIPFILVHVVTAHKELRFLFPLLLAAPYMLAQLWQALFSISARRVYRIALFAFAAFFTWQNSLYLIRTATEPLNPIFLVLRELYRHHSPEKPITVLTDKRDMYFYLCGLRMNFYMRPNIDVRYVSSRVTLRNYLKDKKRKYYVVYTAKGFGTPERYEWLAPQCKPIYYARPEWLPSVNVNHWVDRTSVMRMCECEEVGELR
jgi:phosphatidylinositol glycan class B